MGSDDVIVDVLLRLQHADAEQRARFERDVLDRLPHRARQRIERIAASRVAAGARRDPWTFARLLDGDAVRDWPYTRYLADAFRRAVIGESPFQVWNLPPQTGKTTWLRRGVEWALDLDPTKTYQYLPYGDRLARQFSTDMLTHIRTAPVAARLGFDLMPDAQTQNLWRTTQGGGMLATTLHGGVAGFGASGGVIVDDPLKNWQAAHSPVYRDEAWHEIASVAQFRLAEGAFLILAHTRWHVDDPTARMEAIARELGIEVEFVVMPMVAGEHDLLGREPGELLAPERYGPEAVKRRAALAGSYLVAALEQQQPIPETGGEFKRDDWRFYSEDPQHVDASLTSWDMKLKDREGGDFVVGLAVARIGGTYRIMHMLRGQWSQRQTKTAIAWMRVQHPTIRKHVIENTGYGPEVITELRNADPAFVLDDDTADAVGIPEWARPEVERIVRAGMSGIVEETVPQQSKLVRARTHTGPKLEAHDVFLPGATEEGSTAPLWPSLVIDEHAAFPPKRGGHDDIVDALSQALKHLEIGVATIHAPAPQSIGTRGPGILTGRGTAGGQGRIVSR
jgi:hypothetical protein